MEENNVNQVLTNEKRKQAVKDLIQIIEDDDSLKKLTYDEVYLERFLISTNFGIDKAADKLKAFYELLLHNPKWVSKDGPIDRKELIKLNSRVMLPTSDKNGRPIYLHKLGNIDCDKMTVYDALAIDEVWLESLFLYHPSYKNGLCVIMDIANIPWGTLKWMSPQMIKLGLTKMHSLPLKEIKFHVVNESRLIQAFIKIIWPFLPDYIKEQITFHYGDKKSLLKYIDPGSLPLEYGGENLSLDYNEIIEDLFSTNDEILMSLQRYRTLRN